MNIRETVYSMMRGLRSMVFVALTIGLMVAGCSEPVCNKEQVEFIRNHKILKNELENLKIQKMVGLLGKKLPPEDIAEQIDNKQNELNKLFRKSDRHAKLWHAEVDGIYWDGSSIIVRASYNGHFYRLYISDDNAKKMAKSIKSGDLIMFSGVLGSETSLTKLGASLAPEFHFEPEEIVWKSERIVQWLFMIELK